MTRRSGLLLGFAILSTLSGAGASSAATITYNVDQTIGLGSVVGAVTTDGATGVLSPSDFTAWSLELNGNGASYHIASSDVGAVVWGSGTDVTASATRLYFNFSGPPGFLVFQDGFSSGEHYYCDQSVSGACLNGASVVPVFYADPSTQVILPTGNQIIGTSAVPEPSTWAMLLIGFAGLGIAAYRRSRKDRTAPSMA